MAAKGLLHLRKPQCVCALDPINLLGTRISFEGLYRNCKPYRRMHYYIVLNTVDMNCEAICTHSIQSHQCIDADCHSSLPAAASMPYMPIHVAGEHNGARVKCMGGVQIASNKVTPLQAGGALMLGGEQDCYGGCTDAGQAFYGLMDEVGLSQETLVTSVWLNTVLQRQFGVRLACSLPLWSHCEDLCRGTLYGPLGVALANPSTHGLGVCPCLLQSCQQACSPLYSCYSPVPAASQVDVRCLFRCGCGGQSAQRTRS